MKISEQITLRMPIQLVEQLKAIARNEALSLNSLLLRIIKEYEKRETRRENALYRRR